MSSMLARPRIPTRSCPWRTWTRSVRSKSPYGRSHIERKDRPLPPPVVPLYPQLVFATDGSTFTQWTTSPTTFYKATRDMHNNPLWHPGEEGLRREGEDEGAMGRFKRRFEGGSDFQDGEFEWMQDMAVEGGEGSLKGGKIAKSRKKQQ